jgi:hypothetical protein
MLFLYKPDFKFQKAEIEKKVCLSAGEFEEFLRNPLEGLPCIEENIDLMQEDRDGIYHCLLVTGEGRRDGVLVESEGYGYARYASYVPDAAALEYESLSEFGAGLSWLVDQMIQAGIDGTRDGNWTFYLDQIQEGSAFSLSDNPALTELLADMLVERPEVSMAYVRSACLELRFYPDFCKNLQEGRRQSLAGLVSQEKDSGDNMIQENGGQAMGTCLKDLLCARWENLHLVHDEIDYGLPHTIVELDGETLTEAGKEAWTDVLDAKVVRVFQGYSGLQMELSGVKASRLDAFSAMLAGYCSVEDYENWVNEPEEEAMDPVIQER